MAISSPSRPSSQASPPRWGPTVAPPPDFLASLGDALSRLSQELGEAARAYQDCLARYAEEKRALLEADYEAAWEEEEQEAGGDEGAIADKLRGLEVAVDFEPPGDDALPPAAPPAPSRTAFYVAPAVPPPRGDACPLRAWRGPAGGGAEQGVDRDSGSQAWTKAVRVEAEHGAHQEAHASMLPHRSGSSTSRRLEVISECSELFTGRNEDVSAAERMVGQRLLPRLGQHSIRSLISGRDLHQAVSAMGLERYTLKEMNHLVHRMAVLINLHFRQQDKVTHQLSHHYIRRSPSELTALAERALWKWPEVGKDASWQKSGHMLSGISPDSPTEHHDAFIPIRALIKALTAEDVVVRRLFGASLCEQLFAIKEVLVTGDANRLVSELTCVRIDDLATRTPEPDFSILEVFMGGMIVANGVIIGLQTDSAVANWGGWLWVEGSFTLLFLLELFLRQGLYGLRAFFRGPDYCWNIFDAFLVGIGTVECAATMMYGSHVSASAMVRFTRLLKLMRLIRLFRLQFMWELQLMIKGLLGGARTLFWALVLLVFVLYILGVLCFSAFGNEPNEHIREMFTDVPTAMFTAFRCVTGDCFTGAGTSATQILVAEYGLRFAACFFLAYIVITLGVFNVILAIYVETTMMAAKQTEDANKGSKERASIRVAHLTKRLLKLFCAAELSFNDASCEQRTSLDLKSLLSSSGFESAEVQDSTSISKELFLMLIQEPEVKKLMDELDLPPDRANLFDSIDADGSGSLEATELVRGLLKVRGEVRKSDQVACILALRAVQATLREMGASLQENRRMLQGLTGSVVPPDPGARA